MLIDHIGIAVDNWDEALKKWEMLLKVKPVIEEAHEQKMRIAIFELDNATVELIGETAEGSPISNIIKKRGTTLHHISFQVDDINKEMQLARERDMDLIDKKPRKGSKGRNIAFFHPRSFDGILVEICASDEEIS